VSEQEGSAVSLMNTHTLLVEGITNKDLDKTLRSFWELESLGIEEVSNDPVCDRFTSTLQVKNGRSKCLFRGVTTTMTSRITMT